jgi:hypothetical protein
LPNTITEKRNMNYVHNRAIGLDQPPEQTRQSANTRPALRTVPPAPLPGPASHPFAVRVQNLMASGRTRGEAMREAVKAAPADHESWLRAVQNG